MARRGRPHLNDDPTLRQIAAKLTTNSRQTARSAIMQSLSDASEANIRRLQRKWRMKGKEYLAEARKNLVRHNVKEYYPSDALQSAVQIIQAELAGMSRYEDETRRLTASISAITSPVAEAFASLGSQYDTFRRQFDERSAVREVMIELARREQESNSAVARLLGSSPFVNSPFKPK